MIECHYGVRSCSCKGAITRKQVETKNLSSASSKPDGITVLFGHIITPCYKKTGTVFTEDEYYQYKTRRRCEDVNETEEAENSEQQRV